MIFTTLCLVGFTFCCIAVWWQGRKHWVRATANAVIALVFGYGAFSRISSGEHSLYIPSYPPIAHYSYADLSGFEWLGIIGCSAMLLVGVVNWYKHVAERG